MDERKIWGLNGRSVYANIVIMEAKWRRVRKGVLGGCVVGAAVVCLVGSSFLSKRAIAVEGIGVSKTKCGDITNNADVTSKVYNPSLFDACAQRKASIARNEPSDYGAIWLGNIRSGNPDYLSAKVSTGIVDNEGEVEVFLRGAVMGPNGAPAGNNTSLTGSAQCIKIYVKQGDKVYYPFSFGKQSDKISGGVKCELTYKRNGRPFETYDTNYVLRRQANPDPFSLDGNGNGIRFGGTRVYADFSKLNIVPENTDRWAVLQKRDGGSIDFKEATVTIQRCFQDGRTYGTAEEAAACWASDSKVKIQGDLMSVRSTVSSGNNSKSTGEVVKSTVTAGPLILDGCETGCNVTFKHEIIVKSGYKFGQRFYRKISNFINRQVAAADSELTRGVGGGFVQFESNDKVYNKIVKLYPGEIYCSKMDYGIGTSSSNHGVIQNTSVCAMVRGTLNTGVSLNVEGEKGVSPYSNGSNYYVVPNRLYYVKGSYISNTQKAYGLRINEGAISGKRFSPSSSVSVSDWQKVLGVETKTLGERMSWNNTVSISDGGGWSALFPFAVGSQCGLDVFSYSFGEDWKCNVKKGEPYSFQLAGVQKTVTMATEVSSSGAVVPSLVRFKSSENVKDNPFLMAEIQTDKVSDTLNLLVPYNFKNSTWVDGGEMKIINLESDFNVTYHVGVGNRENTTLGATYATQVDNATSGVYWCKAKKDQTSNDNPGNVCEGGEYVTKIHKDKDGHEQETLFPNSDNNDNNPRSVAIGWGDLTEQGVEVGDIICAWSWVTPGRSGNDKSYDTRMDSNWGKNNIAYSWNNGNPKNNKVCGQIGKSPTIQVWGGNVLSKGKLNVSSVKEKTIKEKTRWFGSFGELGVFVPSGATSNSDHFASGAALGYEGIKQNGNSKDVLLPSYLGLKQEDSEEIGGGSGRSIEERMGGLKFGFGGDGGIEKFAKALGRKYCGDNASGCLDPEGESEHICDNNDNCKVENETVIIKPGGSVVIGVDDVKNVKDVKISTNVQYEDETDGYDSFSEVPRFVVIAKDIEIECDVTRIDGLLVATGTVNTCKSDTPEDREKEDHSNQLIVNGAIIARGLVANRTYGAGPGIYSIVPAEIVRFDPTLLDLDLGSNDSNPKIVNITELPPRY